MLNRLELLRIVCAAAQAGNFKQAAAHLGVAPQSVTRAVKEAERQLKETLFYRSTRRVQLTPFGEEFSRQARVHLEAIDGLFAGPGAEASSRVEGNVRVTAPVGPGRRLVLPVLLALQRQYPGLNLDIRLSDQHDDVVARGIDIGIRVGKLRDSRFVARPLRQVQFHIVARPAVLRLWGTPLRAEDLARYPVTALLDRETGRPWPWHLADGRSFTPNSPVLLTDDSDAEYEALMAGVGFGQVPDYMLGHALERGIFREALPELRPKPWSLFVYRPQRGPVPVRIRLVFDALVNALGSASGGVASALSVTGRL